MRKIPQATPITLTAEERQALEALAGSRKSEARMRDRARIVLLAAAGMASRAIGREVGCEPGTVSKWRVRYAKDRMAGLSETGDRGAEPKYGREHQKRILAMLDRPPPPGYANWTAPLLARELGEIHEQYIWRFLRAQKIDLSGRKSWCQSTDPEFVTKAADIVGLYMAPPDNAVVLSVDEKPSIQALERAQGYLKLPNGRAMIGQSHDYKRNGTTTLFAAFDVGSGEVIGRHYQRRRRVEFLDFMNRVVAQHPGKEIHVILDNLSTHKPKRDMWLARHPNVRFHYTPTHASWLNQIEIWFSILAGKSLKGASFGSVRELIDHITSFIDSYNESARPFNWTKSVVHQKRLKPCFAVQ
ncbi:MAG TPA: IS630 family transposase [Acetobacteraceae bacterium]|nr:IS630 family transposase [Acetobacteraceae bacterium]